MTYTALSRGVKAALGQDHRYAHVVRVARLAERIAAAHGEGTFRARRAGLLHDLARLFSPERLLDECAARGLAIDDFERRHPIVLHARLGAELAREQFGETDEGVLAAIRHHTLAAPDMPRLAEVVYLADGLEPGRDYPERAALEALALRDLDLAMHGCLQVTLGYQRARGLEGAPASAAALAYYEQRLHERSLLSA